MTLFEEVRAILDGICDFEPEEIILPEFRLVDDLQFGPADFSYLSEDLSRSYGIRISEDEWERIETIGDLMDYLSKKLQ